MYRLLDYDKNMADGWGNIDVKVFRDACAELHAKDYSMSKISQPNIQKYVLIKPNYLCNYISSTIYALSGMRFFRSVMREIYLAELVNIQNYGFGA